MKCKFSRPFALTNGKELPVTAARILSITLFLLSLIIQDFFMLICFAKDLTLFVESGEKQ